MKDLLIQIVKKDVRLREIMKDNFRVMSESSNMKLAAEKRVAKTAAKYGVTYEY